MREDSFVQMLDQFRKNLEELYKNAGAKDTLTAEETDQLLSAAYKELGTASEELQVTLEELVIKSEELALIQQRLEEERQHYKALFEFLPNAYLITDAKGHILQANQSSAALFNVEPRFLLSKPLDIFLPQLERQRLMTKLIELSKFGQQQNWTFQLQPRNGNLVNIAAMIAPTYSNEGKLTALHWSLRQLNKDHSPHCPSNNGNGSLIQENSHYSYQQGDIIPLHPDRLWIVSKGWVKLTTFTEQGEEILIGLVGESMPFGSSLTALPTYQATVLSQNVELVSYPLSGMYHSCDFLQTIVPLIIARLRQTEYLLAIGGIRQVNERVNYLLKWLRENYTEKVPGGDRLRVRLTHQELANACGTTRVTITRFLSQLKKQGKIIYDNRHHIVFLSNAINNGGKSLTSY
ncbi:putative transcriptional regulator, Crp/Fnr family with PAS/PAC sensor [Gloeothece citriformis PCC 7424]|uniref:Putative transcriptional regulator, Crp/Fnr family with PAS/PAC sensor n=1 Tax=Gloeothece citriformis (strain PCC 7424) TaxID=65393 RepID=B7KD83_GLOC7|nr:helix-turn-helix domain-containing protein [Gloeothece citriformis]ACK68903.1 putative transcriptional regulator, Crp/Fnr family with PAS/PAC sensor [Gloeothece citriformis PCC 7424]